MGRRGPKPRPAVERFWTHVDKSNPDGCWAWTGFTRGRYGYGIFAPTEGFNTHAHRFSLALAIGRELERHEYACHHCDNPPCVRPDHLFVGSAKDNIADASAKGRMAFGDRNGRRTYPFRGLAAAPLTDGRVAIVRLALEEGIAGADIARFLGISEAAVSRIRHGSRRAAA